MLNRIKDFIRLLRIGCIHLRATFLRRIEVAEGTVLIVAPHPDDEILGCGGLMRQLLQQGYDVHVVVLSGGEGSHRECCGMNEHELKDARRRLCFAANARIGMDESHIHLLDFPDGRIQEDHQETARLASLLKELCPHTVFVPHWGEGWPDHVCAAKMVKSMAGQDVTVYEYCVWLWYYNVWRLDWKNATVLPMDRGTHVRKCQCVDSYVMPLAPCGKPWSGVLPRLLLRAAKWEKELYFRCQ